MRRVAALFLLFLLVQCGAAMAAQNSGDSRSAGFEAYQHANSLFLAKQFPESMAALDEALQLDPKLVPALTLKAKIAMAAKDFDMARVALEHALAADPSSEYAQFLYGFQFYLQDSLDRALPELEKARKLNPADARASLYLGRTAEGLGMTSRALSLYDETEKLEAATGSPQVGTLLAGSRLLLLAGRLEDCERRTRQALKLYPDSRDVHYEMARLLLRKGDAAAAAVEGETALRLKDGESADRQIHYLLVLAYRGNSPADAARHAQALGQE